MRGGTEKISPEEKHSLAGHVKQGDIDHVGL
jgi:hypothetical protein